jgi:CHAD domain-containing protein
LVPYALATNPVKSETVPPHLNQCSWLEFEEQTAVLLFEGLAQELKAINKKASAKRVHDTRVALRRWDSIWAVLERDGWRTKEYWSETGKTLKKLRKLLGDLRDWDVNMELGDSLTVPDIVLERWSQERLKVAKQVESELRRTDIKTLIKRMRKFIHARAGKLRDQLEESEPDKLKQTAYIHLNPFLIENEELTRMTERLAHDPLSLHGLRLCIKAWRYLLTEFFGLTNLELVRAQQLLGKYNDLHRVRRSLEQEPFALAKDAISKIDSQSAVLMKEFTEFRKSLPYGLRPAVISTAKRETGKSRTKRNYN